MSSQPLPPKKVVALALIEQSSVHLHLDPRAPGVVVPAWFKQQPQLVLQIGMNMPVPIPDLYFDDEKMSCTLSFNRSPFFCIVPWDAVFAMVGDDGRGMVWPESLPPEVAKARSAPREATPEERKLKAVKNEKETPAEKKTAKKSATKKSAEAKTEKKKSAKPAKKTAAKKSAATSGNKKTAAKKPAKSAKKAPKKSPAKAREKKEPEARPSKPDARIVRLPSESRKADEQPRAAQAHKPQAVSRGNSRPSNKPKRELPPYLRVVK
jgi:stringent starvation protein B